MHNYTFQVEVGLAPMRDGSDGDGPEPDALAVAQAMEAVLENYPLSVGNGKYNLSLVSIFWPVP